MNTFLPLKRPKTPIVIFFQQSFVKTNAVNKQSQEIPEKFYIWEQQIQSTV